VSLNHFEMWSFQCARRLAVCGRHQKPIIARTQMILLHYLLIDPRSTCASFGRKIRVLVSGLSMPYYMQMSHVQRWNTHTYTAFLLRGSMTWLILARHAKQIVEKISQHCSQTDCVGRSFFKVLCGIFQLKTFSRIVFCK